MKSYPERLGIVDTQKEFNRRENRLMDIFYYRSKCPDIDAMLKAYEHARSKWWYKFFKLFDKRLY